MNSKKAKWIRKELDIKKPTSLTMSGFNLTRKGIKVPRARNPLMNYYRNIKKRMTRGY